MKLKNRVAVVTGASRGIGRGIALAFAAAGADIVFTYHANKKAADETESLVRKHGVKCLPVKCDASSESDVKALAEIVRKEFGKINILVNNAGTIGAEKPITDITAEESDHVLNTDLRGVFLNCKYLIPLITRGNPVGKIINISSELASKGRSCYSPYTAAKGAVNTLTRSLALEYATDLLVNAVAPGPIETDMILADMEPEWIEKEKDIPLRRLGKVEEIGAAAVLLASDEGNFICGQVFGVNGGAVFIQ